MGAYRSSSTHAQIDGQGPDKRSYLCFSTQELEACSELNNFLMKSLPLHDIQNEIAQKSLCV